VTFDILCKSIGHAVFIYELGNQIVRTHVMIVLLYSILRQSIYLDIGVGEQFLFDVREVSKIVSLENKIKKLI